MKISILVKISKNFDFGQNFRESRLMSIFFKHSILEKKIAENVDFGRDFKKIAILVKNLEYLDFFFLKISILVKIFENFDFVQNFGKSPFSSKFWKISIFVKIFEKQNLGKKNWHWSKF